MAGGPGDDVARHFAFVITRDAADQVNRLWQEQSESMVREPVRPMLWTTENGPFAFEIPPEQDALLSEEEREKIAGLCRQAIIDRCTVDSRDLKGLILGHAREGINFFDYFKSE